MFGCEAKFKKVRFWSKIWFGKCEYWCKRRSTKYPHKSRWGI